MLTLTRKVGQSIIIRGDIVVKVLDIQGRQVQLGVEAPKDVKIERPEAAEKNPDKPG